jgi:hypothetical protein
MFIRRIGVCEKSRFLKSLVIVGKLEFPASNVAKKFSKANDCGHHHT